ncbi:hypothetical protein GCM10027347_24270 [Larkinella harenae]
MPTRFLFLLVLIGVQVQAQFVKPYESPRRWSTTVELGGLSPIVSLNLEYVPLRPQAHFWVIRGGVGTMFTQYSMLTIPHSVSFNFLLNPNPRSCPPPVGFRKRWFLEVGWGGTAFVRPLVKEDGYRSSPMVGVRHYFTINQERTIAFLKAQLTPFILNKFGLWGGVGFGVVI